MSWVIEHATLPDVTLPILPMIVRETGPTDMKTEGLPGSEPILAVLGSKGTGVMIEGYIGPWGPALGYTEAQLLSNYITPLRNLKHQKITLNTPSDIWDGDYVFEDFEHIRSKDHPIAYKYKMLFKKGSVFIIL